MADEQINEDRCGKERLSWLNLPESGWSKEVAGIFARSLEDRGYVRNLQQVLAHNSRFLLAQNALSRSLTVDYEAGLSGRERELIALVVSVQNRCAPCIWGHAAKLREISGDPLWVGAIEVNYRHARLTPRERALADYALKITRAPEEIEEADLGSLRDSGLEDGEILEAAGIAAYFNFSNRLNSALGVSPDRQAFSEHR